MKNNDEIRMRRRRRRPNENKKGGMGPMKRTCMTEGKGREKKYEKK
jgi:hypothetical protein